jgi:AraC family transcriptional regulator
VTNIAFDAGYETHESFTRAFRRAFACSPTEYRVQGREAHAACTGPRLAQLSAPSGIHFGASGLLAPTFMKGDLAMNVTIENMPEMTVLSVRHIGPYNTISEAFARLGELAQRGGLHFLEGAMMVALYHDDPESTPVSELRSDAAIVVPPGTPATEGLTELHIPGGRYARTTHVGPYTLLGDVWSRFMGQWIPQHGHRVGASGSYEVYRNTPMTAKPNELVTDLYVPLA